MRRLSLLINLLGSLLVVGASTDARAASKHPCSSSLSYEALQPLTQAYFERRAELESAPASAAPPALDEYEKNDSIRALKNEPALTEELLEDYGVPPENIRFFHLKSSAFRFKLESPIRLSSENGREALRTVRLSLGTDRDDLTFEWEALRNYTRVLERLPNLRLLVSYKPAQLGALNEILVALPDSIRKRIHPVENSSGQNLRWVQDGSKPIRSSEGLKVLEPNLSKEFHRDARSHAEDLLHLIDDELLSGVEAHFPFEGGNVVVGDRHAFVGNKVVVNAMNANRITRSEALQALRAQFGLPVVEIAAPLENGKSAPVDFHVDVTLAVAWSPKLEREVILLDSHDLFFDLLGQTPAAELQTPEGQRLLSKLSALGGYAEALVKRQLKLDAVEKTLKRLGYPVYRMPGMFYHASEILMNYVNAIFSEHHAIVGDSGIPTFDRYVRKALVDLGFTDVIPMSAARGAGLRLGGIRCLSQTFRWSGE